MYMRLVTGRLAAGKLERNNAKAAVEDVTIELPAIDMANRDAYVGLHQALTETNSKVHSVDTDYEADGESYQ